MTKIFTILILILFANKSYADANDNWVGEPSSGFEKIKVVTSNKYMISTSDERASEAGKKILEKGGSAIDAAIAAQMVLNVVEPHASGIGGGGFLLYYDAKTKKTTYFNGRERAPESSHSKMFLQKNGKPKSFHDAVQGGMSVGTPGLLMALKQSHDKYGLTEWKKLFSPAIKIAKKGYKLDERTNILANQVDYLKEFDETSFLYLDKKLQPKKAGSKIKNAQMADTLEIIATEGIDPFYRGDIAKDIAYTVQNSKLNPGFLSVKDLANYKTTIGDLVCSYYREKYKICSMPPPSSGGITVLQILSILENFDLKNKDPYDPRTLHLILETTKLAYADRNEYIADIKNVPVEQMLDKNYLKKRAKLIDANKASKNVKPGDFKQSRLASKGLTFDKNAHEPPSTTHISVVDKYGNAVSLTSSIEYFFGSGISVRGFMLNNQMTDFSFKPIINGKLVANRVEPNKMPRSSMSPTLVFDDHNNLIMSIGSPGGPRIIQFLTKSIILALDYNYNIQQAVSAPNFVVLNDKVELEKGTNLTKLKPALEKFGHEVENIAIVSGINGVAINQEDKTLQGAADPRRQGKAIGDSNFFDFFF